MILFVRKHLTHVVIVIVFTFFFLQMKRVKKSQEKGLAVFQKKNLQFPVSFIQMELRMELILTVVLHRSHTLSKKSYFDVAQLNTNRDSCQYI